MARALAAPGADEQAKDGIDHRTYRKARHQAEREKWAAYKAARIAALDEGKTTTERAAPAAAVGARCPDGNLRRPRNGRDSHRKSYCRKISESGVTTTLLPPPASVTLRDYQIDALDAVEARDAAGIHRQLIAVPTGCGKTIIFGEVIRRRPGRALVLAYRDELIEQAVDKIRRVAPDADIGVVKAERDATEAGVVVASIQTLARPNRLARLIGPSRLS